MYSRGSAARVPHDGHIGPGGWRSAPQPPQRWTRSCPAAVPAQKNSVSGETKGRMTGWVDWAGAGARVAPSRPEGSPAVATFWVAAYLSIRKSMVATGSPAEVHVLLVVTNQPSPSAVRLGPVTSTRRAETASCSPSLTGRR